MDSRLAALGVSVSDERSEEERVLAERLAERAVPLSLPLKQAVNGGWQYVESPLFPSAAVTRLAELARGTTEERKSLKVCMRGRRAEGDELGAALVNATLRALGDEEIDLAETAAEEPPPLPKTMMEHKQALLASAEMDQAVAKAPIVLEGKQKRRQTEAPSRTGVSDRNRGTKPMWQPVGNVTCPICQRVVNADLLNSHLDRCGTSKRRRGKVEEEKQEEDEPRSETTSARRVRRSKRRRSSSEEDEDLAIQAHSSSTERRRFDDDDDSLIDEEDEEEIEATRRPAEEEEDIDEEEGEYGRMHRSEQIVDDCDEDAFRRRLRRMLDAGDTLGESENEDREEEELWIRPSIGAKLFPHQLLGIRWLSGLHAKNEGGIVGDEMGLGKTAQVAAFLGAVFDRERAGVRRSAIVLAPTTILAHWARELRHWAPRCKVVVLHRSAYGFDQAVSSGHHVKLAEFLARAMTPPEDGVAFRGSERPSFVCCVTSYEALHRLGEALLAKKWGYAVLDEGQKIRNPTARITQLCKQLRTRRRLLLSGTPVQNSLKELWSLFDFACPGKLGTLDSFDAELAAPIRSGGFAGASQAQVQLGYRCAVALKDLIRPYLLRRTKAAVCVAGNAAALPPKTEHVLMCRLTPDQLALYRDVLDSDDVARALRERVRTVAFAAISSLRKICNHPDLHAGAPDDGRPGDVLRSGKLAALDTVLRGWREESHRALIFSQSLKMLDIIEALVRARGWRYARIDGTTSPSSRQALADHFNATDSVFCMLLTTRTGGVGMSLIGADRVVLYDPDWNPQTDAQARERAWRLGQTKPVTIYRFVCAGTIEEKIYHRQIFKQALTNRVLADPKQRRLFTRSELAELFTLGEAAYGDELGERQHVLPDTSQLDEAVTNPENDDSENGDKKVLSALWGSNEQNLATVFSHDALDSHQPELARAAEQEAARAVRALRETSRQAQRANARVLPGTPAASSDILAAIARRNAAEQRADDITHRGEGEEDDHEDASDRSLGLVRRLKTFFDRSPRPPQTADILAHFADVNDPLLFRSILRQVAELRQGAWYMKD